jgi:hypothetical protein
MAQQGYYLRPDVFVRPGDGVYVLRDDGNDGMGKFDWQKVLDLAAPIAVGFGGYLAGKSQPKYSEGQYQGGGAYGAVTPYGASAGIDTQTMILIGGLALVAFMFLKK